ncbi:hypothetical protein RSOLAG1IB_01071 [Rhizoctonia solani AG-1 IB]|uniref:Zn(2)-C6 fungal-type domain-containing protein n=1 Tax=Thanatephorus cucumeris (strain AG1-IB / isolate 7/3/14) TaxID=1108050 RepID=A0A0B7FFV5_THACB|nr:hypothetical protein RSOLAG1IB_01071 [Rhizoctonia solani AG-1 IB]
MAPPQSQKQRSRTGCLPCRKRRKKCDEQLPTCSRCIRLGSHCLWILPSQQLLSQCMNSASEGQPNDVLTGFSRTTLDPGTSSSQSDHNDLFQSIRSLHGPPVATGIFRTEIWSSVQQAHSKYFGAAGLATLELIASDALSVHPRSELADRHVSPESLSESPKPRANAWNYAQEYGPTVSWIPDSSGLNYDFDPDDAIPLIRRSIIMLGENKEPVFVEVEKFYLAFFTRYYYDYASITDLIILRARERFSTSDCLKQGMLSTAVLFRANYEQSDLANSLRDHVRELHSLAVHALQAELGNHQISPWVKLSGIMELVNHEYYAGNLSSYYHHLSQAAPLVKAVLQSNTMDLLNLAGEHTFDIRLFAWCDIMGSMALSRPTLIRYESEIPDLPQHSAIGEHHAHPDSGVEWIFGCPDVLAVLLARTTSLRHIEAPEEEKMARGKDIESFIRDSKFGLVRSKSSIMRVARLAAQELWRHAAILNIHHAIFKSNRSHPVVQDSVKNIVRLASTLKPGVSPDCFLSVPYFIAGFFAISHKHRHILRGRILGCGNERFLRHLAEALDDLWKDSGTMGGSASWTGDHPPKFIF